MASDSTFKRIVPQGPIDVASLRGKNALVTGGSSGLGAAFVTFLAENGAKVVIADLNQELGSSLEKTLNDAGHRTKFVSADVSSWDSQVQMVKETMSWLDNGALDIVITCAGIGGERFDLTPEPLSALESSTTNCARSRKCIETNLIGSLYTCQLVLKFAMGRQSAPTDPGFKSLTLVCSIAGYRGLPTQHDYTAAKFGVRGLFKNLRAQSSELGVRINMIAPAFVKTPLTAAFSSALEARGVKFATIEHVVESVARIATDKSVSGRSFAVTWEGVEDLQDEPEGADGVSVFDGFVQRHVLSGPPT